MPTKEEGKQWLRTVIAKHLPTGVSHYNGFVYAGGLVTNAFGGECDPQPQEGKVVDESAEWLLVKVATSSMFAIGKGLLEHVPEVGAVVRITPYARRRFDGTRLDVPAKKDAIAGTVTNVFVICEARSELPVDKGSIRCPFLRDLVEQVEERVAPDGIRTIAQVLIDAGAVNLPVGMRDPSEEDEILAPPTLQFRINNTRFKGFLNIVLDRATDSFTVQLAEHDTWSVVKEERHVYFSSLAAVIVGLVDDGKWRFAKVDVLKSAPRRTKAAA
ncbi:MULTISPECIES: hypothetical protein [Caballeronia]|uniref:hypothetical protein n=1 Tax=Caballeronia TaxID=1827195 RepID=UPI001FD5C727|nr:MULTISPECIES: hypothetical protein [Caballeronia]MDR5798933.1 hypothetical protein [Caballeronia sp. LZ001]